MCLHAKEPYGAAWFIVYILQISDSMSAQLSVWLATSPDGWILSVGLCTIMVQL